MINARSTESGYSIIHFSLSLSLSLSLTHTHTHLYPSHTHTYTRARAHAPQTDRQIYMYIHSLTRFSNLIAIRYKGTRIIISISIRLKQIEK
jgi:hypothetical protein